MKKIVLFLLFLCVILPIMPLNAKMPISLTANEQSFRGDFCKYIKRDATLTPAKKKLMRAITIGLAGVVGMITLGSSYFFLRNRQIQKAMVEAKIALAADDLPDIKQAITNKALFIILRRMSYFGKQKVLAQHHISLRTIQKIQLKYLSIKKTV